MLLVFGWRARNRALGSGTFACPSCGTDRPYAHKEARRWFTLFFVPVIPLKVLGDFVECEVCGGTFDPAVLAAPTAAALSDHLLGAVREGLVAVLGREPTPAARAEAVALLSGFAGREWSEADLDRDLAELDTSGLSARLATLAPVLTEQGKERLIGGLARAAATGGVLSPDQRAAVERLAAEVGMTAAHTRGLIDEAIETV
ncbi:MAG TPA: zinc ribbon domain-containing protein [Acidimicrobiales bacterium]|nr:zinc ribbon domain-containing protein [Acidimicrobiales bacterium]